MPNCERHIISAIGSLPTKVARITLNERIWDASGDIRTYIQSGFAKISSRVGISQPWPSGNLNDALVEKPRSDFVYALTVLKYVGDQDSLPTIQLEHVH